MKNLRVCRGGAAKRSRSSFLPARKVPQILAETVRPRSRKGAATLAVFHFIHLPAGHRCHRALGRCGLAAAHAPPPAGFTGAVAPPGTHGAWKSTEAGTLGTPPVSSPRLRKPLRVLLRWHGFSHGRGAQRALLQRYLLRAVRPRGHARLGTGSARRRGRMGCYVVSGSRARRHRWLVGGASGSLRVRAAASPHPATNPAPQPAPSSP